MVYLTGDTHGRFDRIQYFCDSVKPKVSDVMIILGDVGLNYYGGAKDMLHKQQVSSLPITLFCVHGNHEMRPNKLPELKIEMFHDGAVWYEPEYPNIVYPFDSSIYTFGKHKCMVVGGAYSVDKYYRLEHGYQWFEDEQPDEVTKRLVESEIYMHKSEIDVMLTHTCPYKYVPREVFLPSVDQSTVDNSTEKWFDTLETQLNYKKWYCGHYHTDKTDGKIRFLYNDIIEME